MPTPLDPSRMAVDFVFKLINEITSGGDVSPDSMLKINKASNSAKIAFGARKSTVQILREIAAELDSVAKLGNGLGMGGGAVAITGTCLTIAGGVASIVTAGAAIPFLVGGLLWTGVGVGLTGGAMKVGGAIYSSQKQQELTERLRVAIEDDLSKSRELRNTLADLSFPEFDNRDFLLLLNPLTSGMVSFANVKGGKALVELLLSSLPLLTDLGGLDPATNMLLKTAMSAVAETSGKVLGMTAVVKGAKGAGEELALKAVADVVEGPTKKIAFHVAKAAAAEVIKEGGDEAAVMIAAKSAAQSVVATSARIVGGFTVAFGVAFLVWESVLLYKQANKVSLGDALRSLAKNLEEKETAAASQQMKLQ